MRRSRPRRRWNRRNTIALLVVISLAGLIAPSALTGRLIGFSRLFSPFQQAATSLTNAAGDSLSLSSDKPVSAEKHSDLQRENEYLRNSLVSMAARNASLERERSALAGIRERGLMGGKLIAARVVAADALAWRASRLIDAGSLSGVRADAAVASNRFSIASEDGPAARDGQAVLAGEVLVGFISQVGAQSARLVLLTDVQTHLRVCIARLKDRECVPLDADFWLVGAGREMLEIHDVDHRYIKNDAIQKGDVVFSNPNDPRLPASLMVGTVSDIRQDVGNALLYVLDVSPTIKPADLREVYVVDRENQDRGGRQAN